MPRMKIHSYTVSAARYEGELEKEIDLYPEDPECLPIKAVVLFFTNKWSMTSPGKLTPSGDRVAAYFSYDDFSDIYSILQTENTCSVEWMSLSDEPGSDIYLCRITTALEPTGEGPKDHSP